MEGKSTPTLGLVWTLILHFQASHNIYYFNTESVVIFTNVHLYNTFIYIYTMYMHVYSVHIYIIQCIHGKFNANVVHPSIEAMDHAWYSNYFSTCIMLLVRCIKQLSDMCLVPFLC